MKAIKTLAELKVIPFEKLPNTLKTPILLPRTASIVYQGSSIPPCNGICNQFMHKYAPAIRYHNPGIKVARRLVSTNETFLLVEKKDSTQVKVDTKDVDSPEKILERVKEIDGQ